MGKKVKNHTMRHKKGKKRLQTFREGLIIFSVLLLFFSAACMNKIDIWKQHEILFLAVGILDFFALVAWLWIGSERLRLIVTKEGLPAWAERNKGVILTLVYCFAVRFVQLGDTPRWDAMYYYSALASACESFDFKLSTFFSGFSLFNHPTLGYAGICAIGEFLNSRGYIGVLFVWLIINLMTAFCLYRIFEKILPKSSWIYHTLAVCVSMSTPIVLGTFSYFQPDAGIVSFLIFIVYCYIYRRNLLMFFSMVLLLETKEVGIVVLGAFCLGTLLGGMIFNAKEKSIWKRIIQYFKEPLGISCILAVCALSVFLVFFFVKGGTIWQISNDSIAGFSTFSIQPSFIAYKWKQFFILNFNWLIWGSDLILFLLCGLNRRWRKVQRRIVRRKDIVLAFALTAFFLIVFYSIYVTYALPRYQTPIDFIAVFLLMILIASFFPEKRSRSGVRAGKIQMQYCAASVIGVLLLIQAFTTIDPVSLALFDSIDSGSGKIIIESRDVYTIQRDFCAYNHQFNYLNRAYDCILRDVEYDGQIDILIWGLTENEELGGFGYQWDMQSRKRTMKTGEDIIPIRVYDRDSIDRGVVTLGSEAVFVLTPQFSIEEEAIEGYLKKFYEIRSKNWVDIPFGGRVTYYICDKVVQGGAAE